MPDERGHPIWYRILFTKDDDLDLTQAYFAGAVLFAFFAFSKAAAGSWQVSTAAWAFLGSVFATLAITGTPRWVAELIAKSRTPGDVAAGIAESRPYGSNTYDFDVRQYLDDARPRE